MSDLTNPVNAIARKDVTDAMRDRFILIVIGFIALAAMTSLLTGAIALATDVANPNSIYETSMAAKLFTVELKAEGFLPVSVEIANDPGGAEVAD